MKKKKFSGSRGADLSVNRMVEEVVGCKWSLRVLQLARQGVSRPGSMRHAVPGLTAKVLSERLRKLVRFGILDRVVYPEVPPHVEYKLTPFGKQFTGILDAIEQLDRRWRSNAKPPKS
ncbi:MAG TPA: winged helix-turn-helix transcriptional regulator [Terriglobia bacterium]|nr:winged helix-turn-helix transcriptional regulator [Terriglobia bacterium]